MAEEKVTSRQVGVTEETLLKVYRTLRRTGLDEDLAMRVIQDLQAQGILFREWLERPEDIIPWKHKPGYRVRNSKEGPQYTGSLLTCPHCQKGMYGDTFEKANEVLNQHIRESHRNLEEAP